MVALGQLAVEASAAPSAPRPRASFISQDELVRSAAAYNPDLRAAGITLELARSGARGAQAPFDWVLESGSAVRQSLSPDPFDPGRLRQRSTGEMYVQLSRLLRTGASLRLRLAEAYNEYPTYSFGGVPSSLELTIPGEVIAPGAPDLTFPVAVRSTAPAQPRHMAYYSTTGDLSVVQPILRGASIDAIDAPQRLAHVARRRARGVQHSAASQVVAQVLRIGAELSLAHADRSLRLAARDLAGDELDVTRAKIAAGQLPEIAELQIRQTVAERDQASLMAERTIGDLDVELRRAIGLPVTPGGLPLAPETPRPLDRTELPPAELVRRALTHNPEIEVARSAVDEARVQLAAAHNALLPRLDASAGVGLIAHDPDSLGALRRFLSAADGFNWHIGLVFALPLENREAQTRVDQERLTLARARLDLEDLETRLQVEIVKADRSLAVARKRRRAAQLARDLAARTADGEAERYHLGLTTTHDLLDAQERLRQAEFALRRAETDIFLAEVRRLEVTGDLLDAVGIALHPNAGDGGRLPVRGQGR